MPADIGAIAFPVAYEAIPIDGIRAFRIVIEKHRKVIYIIPDKINLKSANYKKIDKFFGGKLYLFFSNTTGVLTMNFW